MPRLSVRRAPVFGMVAKPLTTSYEIGVRYVLQSERMGHEVPGMRGVYSHITPRMRAELTAGLQELWEASLHERSQLAARSAVAVLDRLLAPFRGAPLHDPLPFRSQNRTSGREEARP
jgi:hypothetical protein